MTFDWISLFNLGNLIAYYISIFHLTDSEGESSVNAKVSFGGAGVGTYEFDSIVAIWSIGWDVPSERHVKVIGKVFDCILVVLVIEWGTVPVDVNVDIVNMDIVRKDTSKVEGDVLSLSKWIWCVGGG